MPSDGVVLGEARFAKEAVQPSWFQVVFHGQCLRGSLETSKMEVLEANCGLASVHGED